MTSETTITLPMIRERLTAALVSDALDSLGLRHQSPNLDLRPFTQVDRMAGRAKTTLWADMVHEDPQPYELELKAVDECREDDVIVCVGCGSLRAAVWGELLSTAASANGCRGVIVDGAIRDVAKMDGLKFPCFALATRVYDSMNRQHVIDLDVPVELGGVVCHPGDLVIADLDGVVIVPQEAETETLQRAWKKAHTESEVLADLRRGLGAREAYRKHGTL